MLVYQRVKLNIQQHLVPWPNGTNPNHAQDKMFQEKNPWVTWVLCLFHIGLGRPSLGSDPRTHIWTFHNISNIPIIKNTGRSSIVPPIFLDGSPWARVSSHLQALLINFVRCSVLTRINFKGKVRSAKWSPDGKWLIVTQRNFPWRDLLLGKENDTGKPPGSG